MTDAVSRISELSKFGWVLGLERMNVLLDKLGNPHEDLKVIHVAGTNGKGSVCRYIYEVLQASGYRCGLFTSPFLEVFNERIEFDGAYISDEDLQSCSEKVLDKVSEMTAEGFESPTEFEVITAVAFLYFMEKKTDYVVLEVGLGGRGDSTNVVKEPLVSVITSVSLDHTDRLGKTVAEIAGEKAGIIKAGCPVVTSAEDPQALAIIRARCAKLSAPLYETAGSAVELRQQNVERTEFAVQFTGDQRIETEISMIGGHQVKNAVCALKALAILQREEKAVISEKALQAGLKRAKQIGRFEIMEKSPYLIIDGAHNPDGAEALEKAVKTYFPQKRVLIIVGILADKEVDQVLDTFCRITCDFAAAEPDNPRKLSAENLAEKIAEHGGKCRAQFTAACAAAAYGKEMRKEYDVVLFTGSLYFIGAVRRFLHGTDEPTE